MGIVCFGLLGNFSRLEYNFAVVLEIIGSAILAVGLLMSDVYPPVFCMKWE